MRFSPLPGTSQDQAGIIPAKAAKAAAWDAIVPSVAGTSQDRAAKAAAKAGTLQALAATVAPRDAKTQAKAAIFQDLAGNPQDQAAMIAEGGR